MKYNNHYKIKIYRKSLNNILIKIFNRFFVPSMKIFQKSPYIISLNFI